MLVDISPLLAKTFTYLATNNSCILTLGSKYKALHMNVQYPSEHTIGGVRYDAEMHMGHTSVDPQGNYFPPGPSFSVVALTILLQKDDTLTQDDLLLSKLLTNLHADSSSPLPKTIPDPYGLFAPAGTALLVYPGSANVYPCGEVVTWVVRPDPVKITPALLNSIKSANMYLDKAVKVATASTPAGSNVRPIQPTNSRLVNTSFVKTISGSSLASSEMKVASLLLLPLSAVFILSVVY